MADDHLLTEQRGGRTSPSTRRGSEHNDTEVGSRLDMPVLEQVRPLPTRSWGLDCERLTIGRDPHSDVIVSDPGASRHHASLVRHGLSWTVVDEASTNGTIVNGKPVQQAVVQSGDRIEIGGTELMLRWQGGLAPAPPPQGRVQYDVGSQSGNINNVAGNQSNFNQANYFRESNLRYVASRRGLARRLIMSGIVSFFVGWGTALFAVLSFQNAVFNAINSQSFQQPDLPPAFIPVFGAGAFLTVLGLALFIFGLITRSGAKRDAARIGAPW